MGVAKYVWVAGCLLGSSAGCGDTVRGNEGEGNTSSTLAGSDTTGSTGTSSEGVGMTSSAATSSGAMSSVSGSTGGSGGTSAVFCPSVEPALGSACATEGQTCGFMNCLPPEYRPSRTLTCTQGAWTETALVTCEVQACPSAPPNLGDSCDAQATPGPCLTPDACGQSLELYCVAGVWAAQADGGADMPEGQGGDGTRPAPACPSEAPVLGTACCPNNYPEYCEYGAEELATGGTAGGAAPPASGGSAGFGVPATGGTAGMMGTVGSGGFVSTLSTGMGGAGGGAGMPGCVSCDLVTQSWQASMACAQ